MSEDEPAAYQSILAGLDQVDVESLAADPFKPSDKPAWRSAQAIDRAVSYLDLALADVQSAIGKLAAYSDASVQSEREAAAESEARIENSSYDRQVAAKLAELARERAQLEQEKMAAPEGTTGFIAAQIAVIKSLEENLPKDTPMSALGRELSADGLNKVRTFNAGLAELHEAAHQQLKVILGELQQVQRRRRQAQARRERFRAGALLGYAILVVVIGVFTDVALGHTKLASLWASLIAATALWAIDRWLISPKVERWSRSQALNDLKAAVDQTASSLQVFARIGADLNQQAARAGLPELEFLSNKLLHWPDQAAEE